MGYNRKVTIANGAEACAVEAALSIISGKWKHKIYKALKHGDPVRFSSISRALGNISEKTLTAQLREMEKDGILTRIVFPEVPPRVEYQLTELGHSLAKVFMALKSWGKDYIQQMENKVSEQ